MKKIIILLSLLALSFCTFSCGGGAGSSNTPEGENPGVPSRLVLAPDKNVAPTGSYVNFHATVLDGNGHPVEGKVVNFTNVAGGGTFSATSAVTNGLGIATVNLRLTSDGFATAVAETAGLRDKRSVYFTSGASTRGLAFSPITVDVDIDEDNNGIYNESEDLRICQTANDNVLRIRTTVYAVGARAPGVSVNVQTDYDILSTFPNTPFGTDNDADGDIDEDNIVTNSQGEAFTELTVNCLVENVEKILNVFASTSSMYVQEFDGYFSGAGGQSLFLQPVTVTGITVTANPTAVAPSGTSTIRATVNTTGGNDLDNISVQFSTTCGTVSPTLAQTVDGIAQTTFTAPSTAQTCTITAKVGTVTGTVSVPVYTTLTVTPSTLTLDNDSEPATVTFMVSGGVAPYTIWSVSTNVNFTYTLPATLAAAGALNMTGIVLPEPNTGTITIYIRDSAPSPSTVTVVITVVD